MGKVVVLTGGASGIGAATVKQLLSQGANVVHGDVSAPQNPEGDYLRTDVTKYLDVLALFKLAFERYGRIDHAVSNAGLIELPGWFQPGSIANLSQAPPEAVLDVNLKGTIYFAHIALQYLAEGSANADKSLILMSSQAGFKETPGLFVYQTTKHGVLGLLRSLRLYTLANFGVRINAICPSMTTTQMVAGVQDGWIASGNPINRPEDVAEVIVAAIRAGPSTRAIWYDESEGHQVTKSRMNVGQVDWDDTKTGLNGRALYILGGQVYDIEEGLDRTEDLWLGSKVSKKLEQAQKGLGTGDNWVQ